MSDIAITFPAWMTPLLMGVLYWPFLLSAAIVLTGLAIFVRGWLRVALFALAILMLLPCLTLPVVGVVNAINSASERRAWARTHETLSAALTIQGLGLPAGTAVTWADERHEAVVSVELPGPTPLLGTTLTGTLEDVARRWWSGTLAADAMSRRLVLPRGRCVVVARRSADPLHTRGRSRRSGPADPRRQRRHAGGYGTGQRYAASR